MSEQKTKLLTPRTRKDGDTRLELHIDADVFNRTLLSMRCLGYKGTVTDIPTGRRYAIFGQSCSLQGCNCDAYAVEVFDESI